MRIAGAVGLLGAAGVSFLMGGCASVPQDAGFGETRAAVEARTGARAVWNRGGEEDREVAEQTSALLAKDMSADDAVQLAVLNNPELQVVYEELGVAQADVVQAGLLKNPVFSASVRFPARPYHGVDAGVEEEFVDLLFLPARKKMAESEFAASKARVGGRVVALAAEVRRAYYRAAAAGEIVGIRKEAQDAADSSAELAGRLFEAGNITELARDSYRAEAGQSKLDAGDAALELAEARQELAKLMGLTMRLGEMRVAGGLAELPVKELAEEELRKRALGQRLEVIAARQEAAALLQQKDVAGTAAAISGGSVGAELVRDPDVKTTIGPAVSVAVPVFDQGQAANAKAVAQWRQAQARVRETGAEVTAEVGLAFERMSAARDRAAFDRETLFPLRQRMTQQTLQQYNGMLASPFALIEAKRAELSARVEAVQAVEAYWIARADMEKAIGGKLTEDR